MRRCSTALARAHTPYDSQSAALAFGHDPYVAGYVNGAPSLGEFEQLWGRSEPLTLKPLGGKPVMALPFGEVRLGKHSAQMEPLGVSGLQRLDARAELPGASDLYRAVIANLDEVNPRAAAQPLIAIGAADALNLPRGSHGSGCTTVRNAAKTKAAQIGENLPSAAQKMADWLA